MQVIILVYTLVVLYSIMYAVGNIIDSARTSKHGGKFDICAMHLFVLVTRLEILF